MSETVATPAKRSSGSQSARGDARKASPRADRARAEWRKRLEIVLLTGPAIIVFLAFVIVPVFLAAYYGFFQWKGFGIPTKFVGFQNYITIFTDQNFLDALTHNGLIVVMSLIMQGPAAIAFALLLNQNIKGRSLIRILIFVPYVISEVIVGTGWSLMLQYQGALNALLNNLGLSWMTADWIADPNTAIWTLMVIISWKYLGFAVILMLAGMQGIPDELYEAAAIDGASYWRIQRWITLPLLGPTIRVWAFLSIIGSLQLFDLVYIIWGQYVSATAGTSTMATYMVREGRLSGNYGYGNAVAVAIFAISLVVALTYQRFVLRRDTEGALTEGPERKAR